MKDYNERLDNIKMFSEEICTMDIENSTHIQLHKKCILLPNSEYIFVYTTRYNYM